MLVFKTIKFEILKPRFYENPFSDQTEIPLDTYALVLMALGGNHHISFIQNKHLDLLGFDELQLLTPVQDSTRSTNHNLFRQLCSSLH